jgi:hypothetical protein
MRSRHATPADLIHASVTFWSLMAETQMVMAYRMLGMAGLWSVTGTENATMVSEKAPAFALAGQAAARAAMSGQRPDQIAVAAMKPLRRKTGANSRRLAKRGPRLIADLAKPPRQT